MNMNNNLFGGTNITSLDIFVEVSKKFTLYRSRWMIGFHYYFQERNRLLAISNRQHILTQDRPTQTGETISFTMRERKLMRFFLK